MNKFYISSGHGKIVRGAKGYIDEVEEARKVTDKVAYYIKKIGGTVYTFHDDTSKTQNTNLTTIVTKHNSKARDLDISVHFNANKTTSSPMGCEVLHYGSAQKSIASKVSKAIATAGGFKDRGAKARPELYFLKNTDKPAILLEVCFVDSKADADLYKKNFDKICRAIAEAVTGKKIPADKPASTTTTMYRVCVGSYKTKANAEKLVKELEGKGYSPFITTVEVKN